MLCSFNTRLKTKKWGQTFGPDCSAHLLRSNIFRAIESQCLHQVSTLSQAILFMNALDVVSSSDTVE
jgi:hypothetical protein